MSSKFINGRPTIGLLSNTIDGGYQQTMLSGFINAAEERDVNTIYFSGGILNAFDLPRNRLHELITANRLDGLVIVSSIVCGYINQEETLEFFGKFDKLPKLSIGMQLANVPSIIIDNKSGMRSIVDHLIEKHGHRNFYYIGGPANNLEADIRFQAFKESLEDHDIRIDPEMIVNGNFFPEDKAYELTKEILNNNIYPDAIVCANDIMAVGSMKAILEKKMMIPDDIAVTGYDDLKYNRYIIVPLTTIRQPFAEMTMKALNIILDMIDGKNVAQTMIMNTEPVIRRSCGCLIPEVDAALKNKYYNISNSKEIDAGIVSEKMISELSSNYSFENMRQKTLLIKTIIDMFVKAVKGDIKKDKYASRLDKIFRQSEEYEEESIWNVFFGLLQKIIFAYYGDFPEKIMDIADITEISGIIINKISHQNEQKLRTKINYRSEQLQRFESRLLISFDNDFLLNTMAAELGSIGISSCFMSFHSTKDTIFRESRIIFAFKDDERIDIDENEPIYPADSLIPDGLIIDDRRFDFIIESLLYEEEQLGFIIIETDTLEGILLSPMVSHIASSIKASMVMNEAVQKGKDLEAILNELKNNHEKLLISEKMASLGRLTAGIAHEMNTPLATVRASIRELMNLINEYKESINKTDISIKDHHEISDEMENTADLAEKALIQAISFIKGIKSQTREMGRQEGITFNVIDVINESLLFLSFILKKNNFNIDFKYSKNPIELFGIPGRMTYIITNLVTNAVDAMENKKNESIMISLAEEENNIILSVEDKGRGISESILTKIFDPLFTTKPFGQAAGLGLTVVHDIVYGDFGGTITVESRLHEGTIFTLRLPKK